MRVNLLLPMVFLFSATNAQAVSVYNLTDREQTLEVVESGGYKPIRIEAGRSYYAIGKVVVRFNGREVRIDDGDEYAIWSDTEFGPQQRNNIQKKRF